MKKYIMIFAVIMAASLLASCSDNRDEPKESGGGTTININADAAPDETTGMPADGTADDGTDAPDDGTAVPNDGTDAPDDGTTNVTPPSGGMTW